VEAGWTVTGLIGEKFIEFRRVRVIATTLLRTMGQNCCRMSRDTLKVQARFNRNVRIAVHISALGRGDQIGPAASVTFFESHADADEFGDVETLPLLLPTRWLVY
jgi:hypothetical protein